MLDELNRVKNCFNTLDLLKQSCEQNIPVLEKNISKAEETLTLISESREYLRKAIDLIYSKSIGDLEYRLNCAIKYIYFDRDFSVSLLLDDKRGKSLQIILKDENGDEVSLKDGCGAGIRCIISFVLHSYYLLSSNSKILLIDEKYSQLSQGYVERFFEFAKKLCETTKMSLVMITHDTRFLNLCDNKYKVINGVVNHE